MRFERALVPARLLRRYQRFLADVEFPDGTVVTVHCPNTGSMLGCTQPGRRVWLSESDSTTRKYRYTWQMIEVRRGIRVGINTGLTNRLAREGIEGGIIDSLAGYPRLRAEVAYGHESSRVDFLLEGGAQACYVEVKNVTAAVENGVALFPDAVSERASKHLRELTSLVRQGARAVILFCAQRADVNEVRPADEIDPRYGQALRCAVQAGVEAIAYRARVSPREIALVERIPVVIPAAGSSS